MEESADWIIDSNGLYVATCSFLMRRGYCCANQCRNCPYVNWRNSPLWKPLPAEMVRRTRVSPKAIEGAREALMQHEREAECASQSEEAFHQGMIAHYRWLLKCWEDADG